MLKKLLNFFIAITLFANYANAQGLIYCTTSTNNHAGTELIGRVQFGTIDNTTTSTVMYENFTNLSTTVTAGSTIPITITGAGSYSGDQVYVWIDFNQDGDFTDPGEAVFTSTVSAGPYTGTVAIPAGATLGFTRMRVKIDDTGGAPANNTPCGLADWGQVEDYSVNVLKSYCTTSTNNHAGTELIGRVQFGSIDNTTTSTAMYENFINISTTVDRGSTIPITITGAGSYSGDQVYVWIDFNQDGDFTDPGEAVYTSTVSAGPYTGTVAIPAGATLGFTRMRVKIDDTGGAPANNTPCGLADWGQVEDYSVNVLQSYCTTSTNNHAGTELIGRVQFGTIDNTTTSTVMYENFTNLSTTVVTGTTIPITITGAGSYSGDQVYVWIDFNQDGDFTDPGEAVYTSTVSAGPYIGTVAIPAGATLGITRMRVKIDDTGGAPANTTPCGLADWGQVEDYSVNIQSAYCATSTNNHPGTELIGRVQFGSIDNTSTSIAQYEDFTNLSTFIQPGSVIPITITGAGSYSGDQVYVWIDFNQNGVFTDPGELVYTSPVSAGPYTGTVAVPIDALKGFTRMRVKIDDTGGAPANTTPCGLADWGQVEDYTVNVQNCSPANITTQPVSSAICIGGNGTFRVVAAGTALTYQWQVSTDTGTTWVNLTNTAPYSGVTTNTLTITGATTALANYRYRVRLNGTCTTPNTASNAGTLTINTAAAITTQPVATITDCRGTNQLLIVAATGSNPTFQWEVSKNGGVTYTNVAGATNDSLTLTSIADSMSGYRYRVKTTVAGCGTVTSTATILTVNVIPTITLAAAPYTRLFPSLTTTLTATASPALAGNTFKWFRNGVQVVGATTGILANLNVDQLGVYTATVTSPFGCTSLLSADLIISEEANTTLFITPNPNTGQFKVRFLSSTNNRLTRTINIYDTKGARVFTKYYLVTSPFEAMDVDMGNQNAGVYIVEVGDYTGRRLKVGTIVIL